MRRFGLSVCLSLVLLGATRAAGDAPKRLTFEQSADEIDAFDFVEVKVKVAGPTATNPFRDVAVTGRLQWEDASPLKVEGFCDSPDGSLHRIRFMPTKPGQYSYTVEFRQGDHRQTHSGKFTARDGKRRGLVRIDKEHPWHFVWERTGEHYFWNGTTTYWLLGWQDEDVIRLAIDRLAGLKVNRLRVALCGRTKSGDRWFEPLVVNTDKFQFRLNPWIAQRPDSVERPGFDVTRYNVPFWQKCDRMLRYAREKGMVISIIFYLDGKDPGVDHIVTCFTSLKWWKMQPRDDLVNQGAYCLAEPGQQYLVYLPKGGKAEVKLDDGKYQAQWCNPPNGKWAAIGGASGPKWTSPKSPDEGDWAVVLRRRLAPPEAVTDERTERARTLVAQMASGQFDKATEPFDETMKRVLPADNLKQAWDGVTKQYGPLQRTTETRTETIQKYKATFVTCEFQRGPLDVKVVFASDNKIAGLFFAPSGKYKRPPYADPSKFDEEEVTVGKGLLTLAAIVIEDIAKWIEKSRR